MGISKNICSLFEYQSADWSLNKSDILRIENLNSRLGAEVLSIKVEGGSPRLRGTSYVGVTKIGKKTIEILPKVDQDDKKLATRNLLHLLSYTKKLRVKECDISHFTQRDASFFEILIYLFAKNLWSLIKKGLYKEYIVREEQSAFLRGKWLLSRQLAQPPTQKNNFHVSYDDFSEENALNRIFKYAVTLLRKVSTDARNQQLLLELSFALNDVEFEFITREHFARLNVTRLNQQYIPVLELARLFILNSSLQMSASDVETYAFVFDMNVLFEEFIYEFIVKHRDMIVPDHLKSCDVKAQCRNKHLVYREDNAACFRLQPDIIFIKPDGHSALIIDTKYKLLTAKDRKLGIAQADMYQMFAYAKKYDCCRILLLYPLGESKFAGNFKIETDGRERIYIGSINIGIDIAKEHQLLIKDLKATLGGIDESSHS